MSRWLQYLYEWPMVKTSVLGVCHFLLFPRNIPICCQTSFLHHFYLFFCYFFVIVVTFMIYEFSYLSVLSGSVLNSLSNCKFHSLQTFLAPNKILVHNEVP